MPTASYRWYNTSGNLVSTGNTFTPYVTVSTTFYVEAVNGGLISPTKAAQITVNPLPDAIIVNPPTSVNECETVTFQAYASGGTPPYTSYQWISSGHWAEGITYTHRFTNSGDQLVGLYVRDALGCFVYKTVTVSVKPDELFIPNVFTPNGDGLNDFFAPARTKCLNLYDYSMEIYGRWGNLIASLKNTPWDGRGPDGQFVNNDTYYYSLVMNSNTRPPLSFKGWVTMWRFSSGRIGDPEENFSSTNSDGSGLRVGDPEENFSSTNSDGFGLRVYPNPAKNALTLNYTFGQYPKGEMNYTIVDALGRKAGDGSWEVGKETPFGEKTLDISLLPSGVYHLRVWNETKVQSVRFVKQ